MPLTISNESFTTSCFIGVRRFLRITALLLVSTAKSTKYISIKTWSNYFNLFIQYKGKASSTLQIHRGLHNWQPHNSTFRATDWLTEWVNAWNHYDFSQLFNLSFNFEQLPTIQNRFSHCWLFSVVSGIQIPFFPRFYSLAKGNLEWQTWTPL